MTAVRGILFDKDGTLFDFASTWENWAFAFLTRMAADEDQLTKLGRAIGFDVPLRKFEPDSVVIADTPDQIAIALHDHLPHLSLDAVLKVLNEEAASAVQTEATPLGPFLDRLSGYGLRLGVVTNDAEMPARAHLDAAQITGKLDFIAGFDSGHGAKPAPGQLEAFSKAMELDPSQVIMVGDSLHDLIAAKAAGMRAIGVLTGLAEAEVLEPHAVVVLPDIGHIPMWLETQNLVSV